MREGPISRLFACCVLFIAPILGQSINIDRSISPDARKLFQAIGDDIYVMVLDMFKGRPPLDLPITIYRSKFDYPITSLDNWMIPSGIQIGVTAQTDLDQFAFQFAHEMGHVMLNPRRNNGVVDAICVALQLEVLNRLSAKWRTLPPMGAPTLMGVDVSRYARRYESEIIETLPEVATAVRNGDWKVIKAYLRIHRKEIEPTSSPSYRTTQLVAALSILSKSVDWSELTNIAACTDPDTSKDPNFHTLPIAITCWKRISRIACRIGGDC